MAVIRRAKISSKVISLANRHFFGLRVGHIYEGVKVNFRPLTASNSWLILAVEDCSDSTLNARSSVIVGPNSVRYLYRNCGRDEPEDNAIARASHCGFVKLEWIDAHRRFRGCLNICDRDACNQVNRLDYSRWKLTFYLTVLFFFSFGTLWWSANNTSALSTERCR